MYTLESGNVLLKPANRRQLQSWLKRCFRLAERVPGFDLRIQMHRQGRLYELRADVRDNNGNYGCHSRRPAWSDAAREVAMLVTQHIHSRVTA
jgi:hypothetical protein